MRIYARIENNLVAELFDLDAHFPERSDIAGLFHRDIDWRQAPVGCAEGWVVHEGEIVPPDHYTVMRAREYPPLMDLVDGLVKSYATVPAVKAEGDAQVRAYCDAALAVKARFPKPHAI